MSRDDYARQGKQIAADLRDTVGKKVSENEGSIRGTLGKAARWIDQRTGGKYSEQITRAESRVGDGIGKVAAQGSAGGSGTPTAPGAAAGDGTPAGRPDGPTDPPTTPTGPVPDLGRPGDPAAGPTPAGPGAATAPTGPTGPTGATGPTGPTAPHDPHGPTGPVHPEAGARRRPPQEPETWPAPGQGGPGGTGPGTRPPQSS